MSLQQFTRQYNRRQTEPSKAKPQEITIFHLTAAVIIGLGFGLVMAMFITAANAKPTTAAEYYQRAWETGK